MQPLLQAVYIAANVDEYNRDDVRASKREERRLSILFAEQHKRKQRIEIELKKRTKIHSCSSLTGRLHRSGAGRQEGEIRMERWRRYGDSYASGDHTQQRYSGRQVLVPHRG